MTAPNLLVRHAGQNDLPDILRLVRELAAYEKAEDQVSADLETYRSSFKNQHFEALVAVLDGEVVGTALYYRRFSTWKGPILYLEDFIVSENHRGKGIGKRIFEVFIGEAKARGWAMCMWQVLEWNQPAIEFYNKYDIVYDDEWLNVKMFLTD